MIFQLLESRAKAFGDKAAVCGEHRQFSYRELYRAASDTANHLHSLGARQGDPILIGTPPSPEFYIVFYAAAALGLIVFPVLPSGRIPQTIVDRGPVFAVGDEAFLGRALNQCPTLKHPLRWNREEGIDVPRHGSRLRGRRVFRDQCVIGVSSSGTTGTPTIFYRSQELLVRRAKFRARSLDISPEDVLLSARPFNSGSSINSHIMMPLAAGCKIVVQEKFQRFRAADAIAREKVTVLYAVPFVFELLASIPEQYPADFTSIRLCISGSAPLADSVASAFRRRFGVEIRQRYGGSHMHPAFTYNLKGVSGAVGQNSGPFPITVLDEAGKEQGSEIVGELAFDYSRITRPWKKYLKNNPNRRGRYILTGDLGRMDHEGNIFVVGRKSPFIKVRGNRVEPAEVEHVIRSHPGVREAFVYAIKPGQPDESVGAVIVTERPLRRGDIIDLCLARLDPYKCPRTISFRSALPRNEHGKLARNALEAEFNPAGASNATGK